MEGLGLGLGQPASIATISTNRYLPSSSARAMSNASADSRSFSAGSTGSHLSAHDDSARSDSDLSTPMTSLSMSTGPKDHMNFGSSRPPIAASLASHRVATNFDPHRSLLPGLAKQMGWEMDPTLLSLLDQIQLDPLPLDNLSASNALSSSLPYSKPIEALQIKKPERTGLGLTAQREMIPRTDSFAEDRLVLDNTPIDIPRPSARPPLIKASTTLPVLSEDSAVDDELPCAPPPLRKLGHFASELSSKSLDRFPTPLNSISTDLDKLARGESPVHATSPLLRTVTLAKLQTEICLDEGDQRIGRQGRESPIDDAGGAVMGIASRRSRSIPALANTPSRLSGSLLKDHQSRKMNSNSMHLGGSHVSAAGMGIQPSMSSKSLRSNLSTTSTDEPEIISHSLAAFPTPPTSSTQMTFGMQSEILAYTHGVPAAPLLSSSLAGAATAGSFQFDEGYEISAHHISADTSLVSAAGQHPSVSRCNDATAPRLSEQSAIWQPYSLANQSSPQLGLSPLAHDTSALSSIAASPMTSDWQADASPMTNCSTEWPEAGSPSANALLEDPALMQTPLASGKDHRARTFSGPMLRLFRSNPKLRVDSISSPRAVAVTSAARVPIAGPGDELPVGKAAPRMKRQQSGGILKITKFFSGRSKSSEHHAVPVLVPFVPPGEEDEQEGDFNKPREAPQPIALSGSFPSTPRPDASSPALLRAASTPNLRLPSPMASKHDTFIAPRLAPNPPNSPVVVMSMAPPSQRSLYNPPIDDGASSFGFFAENYSETSALLAPQMPHGLPSPVPPATSSWRQTYLPIGAPDLPPMEDAPSSLPHSHSAQAADLCHISVIEPASPERAVRPHLHLEVTDSPLATFAPPQTPTLTTTQHLSPFASPSSPAARSVPWANSPTLAAAPLRRSSLLPLRDSKGADSTRSSSPSSVYSPLSVTGQKFRREPSVCSENKSEQAVSLPSDRLEVLEHAVMSDESDDDTPLGQRNPDAFDIQRDLRDEERFRRRAELDAKQRTSSSSSVRNPFAFSADELSSKLDKVQGASVGSSSKSSPVLATVGHSLLPQTDESVAARSQSRRGSSANRSMSPASPHAENLPDFLQESKLTFAQTDKVQRTSEALIAEMARSQPPIVSGPEPLLAVSQNVETRLAEAGSELLRIFVGDVDHSCTVSISAVTTIKDVLEQLSVKGALTGSEQEKGNWALWDYWSNHGLERPLREYERVADVRASWTPDTAHTGVLIAKKTYFASLLRTSNEGVDANEAMGTMIQMEVKRGKWQKRYLEVKDCSISWSKNEKAKEVVHLCSLARYDAYIVKPMFATKLKCPKPFAFAIKSLDAVTLFEDAEKDYTHLFSVKTADERDAWVRAILEARIPMLKAQAKQNATTVSSAPSPVVSPVLDANTNALQPSKTRTLLDSRSYADLKAASLKAAVIAEPVSTATPFAKGTLLGDADNIDTKARPTLSPFQPGTLLADQTLTDGGRAALSRSATSATLSKVPAPASQQQSLSTPKTGAKSPVTLPDRETWSKMTQEEKRQALSAVQKGAGAGRKAFLEVSANTNTALSRTEEPAVDSCSRSQIVIKKPSSAALSSYKPGSRGAIARSQTFRQ
ncbi:uncharacterized protein L969DRAFT_22375 [Mixia osmundae IAM 14324]|uniref:PH domain-containing protein n=1 Tax=Mixia osmundae (strain CBS 9802 / IAM 14324 / JCM 22182 / KY 12970) TaxID=764103 RepID=G7DTX2_MIXOS|nr:uncharacterized protein L969DRAFT_22375 [Mixia osmundae IAM 14324]KEI41745.1 hypothetical protein L969DRAFT_22375 [Mixia osmundae IAM 14324]GAA94032.1 hypothetical protein E5Q_00679 [Mixia osmundae IAM 14324]